MLAPNPEQCPNCLFSSISYCTSRCPNCGWPPKFDYVEQHHKATNGKYPFKNLADAEARIPDIIAAFWEAKTNAAYARRNAQKKVQAAKVPVRP